MNRPHVVVVLAMSADGKIADVHRSAARFPSAVDKAHLEAQVAKADATLFGAGTLRAYGTTLPVTTPKLLAARQQRQQLPQPIQIVCSATGNLDPQWRFFQQPVPRWLITTPMGETAWLASKSKTGQSKIGQSKISQSKIDTKTGHSSVGESKAGGDQPLFNRPLFEQRLVTEAPIDWWALMQALKSGETVGERCSSEDAVRSPIDSLLVMGGGELVAALLAERLVDELYLTICPVLIGGAGAPTPVGGAGFTLPAVPQLALKSSWTQGNEIFLHYSVLDPAPA